VLFFKEKIFESSKSEAKNSAGDFIGTLLSGKVEAKLSFSLKSVPHVSWIDRIRNRSTAILVNSNLAIQWRISYLTKRVSPEKSTQKKDFAERFKILAEYKSEK